MRVLVEPSDYIIRNIGDTAMMTIALERLSNLWPDARIQVLTDEPDQMPRPGRNIEPLNLTGRRLWFDQPWMEKPMSRFAHGLSRPLKRVRRLLCRSHPTLAYRALRRWGGLAAEEVAQLTAFFEAVSEADLLVVTGMGGITSAFPNYAFELLEVIRCAQRFGAKTAMLGQGLGPIDIKKLRRNMAATLRRVDLLALREGRAGLPLLKTLKVPLARVIVTGDDAIELACRHARGTIGYGIGVNLRHAYYAGVQPRHIQKIRPVLHQLSERIGAPLIGVPICRVPDEDDAITIAELIHNRDTEADDLSRIRTPEDVVVQLQQCRVLVAGSYHAGVFALSSGIPTVALVNSPYYVDKFLGLADMFGSGCRVVGLDEPHFSDRLTQAVLEAWASADKVRAPLLEAAQEQLRQSCAAYAKLKELLA
jgi:polysaccharide pyruvyl transferase WcaK-like protein